MDFATHPALNQDITNHSVYIHTQLVIKIIQDNFSLIGTNKSMARHGARLDFAKLNIEQLTTPFFR